MCLCQVLIWLGTQISDYSIHRTNETPRTRNNGIFYCQILQQSLCRGAHKLIVTNIRDVTIQDNTTPSKFHSSFLGITNTHTRTHAHSAWAVFTLSSPSQLLPTVDTHYSDAIMSAMASQILRVLIAYSTVCSGTDKKHQSSVSLAFEGNSPVTSPHKGPVTWKLFPFHDVVVCRRYLFDYSMKVGPWLIWYISIGLVLITSGDVRHVKSIWQAHAMR